MQSKEDVTIVFAEPALSVLMDEQELLGKDYATMVGFVVPLALFSIA